MAPMDADQVAEALQSERARLEGLRSDYQQEGLRTETEQDSLHELSGSDQHQADVGTETFNRERDLSILEQIEAELADVEHALERLAAGSYGTCEACGRPIDEERLAVQPAARFCVTDQAAAEREARPAAGE